MNILFIHEVDWLDKVVFDIHSLAEAMSLRGHRVYVIDYENKWRRKSPFDLGTLRTTKFDDAARSLPGAKITLKRPGFIKVWGLSRLSAAITHYREIKKTICQESINAIVLYSIPTNGLPAIHLARKFNIPVVFRSIDILNQLVPFPPLRPVTRFLEKKVYGGADMLLTLTPKLSEYVTELGARPSRVKPLLMPVDTALFRPAPPERELRQKWALGDDDPVLLFIGTLFEFSGLDVLLRHFPQVLAEFPTAKLLIVGDGPQRTRLESLITELGLTGRVIITGFEPYQMMPRYINLASICINSFLVTEATRDIFPGKIVQYLACGKAVIATALPGMLAVISGEEQGVVYIRSTDAMAQEMVRLLKSRERRQQLERASLRYVGQAHSYSKIAAQLEARLEEAIRGKREGFVSHRVN